MAEKKLKALVQAVVDNKDGAHRALVHALAGGPVAALVRTGAHGVAGVRAAAAEACARRTEPEILALVTRLADDPFEEVRCAVARAAAAAPEWAIEDEALSRLLRDGSEDARRDAARAARGRAGLVDALVRLVENDEDWTVRQAAAAALEPADPRRCLPVLLRVLALDDDSDVSRACAQSAATQFDALGDYPDDLERLPPATVAEARRRLDQLGGHRWPKLHAWLDERARTDVDPAQLARLGTDLTARAAAGELPRAFGVDDSVDAILRLLRGDGPRAAVLLGPAGAGKTAIVHELVHRLRDAPEGPWRVLRVSPSDLLAGTVYLGEWESKVRRLVRATKAPKRVLVYVPNIEGLSQAGTHSRSRRSVADMLAPDLESGAVALLGEATHDAFRAGIGANPSLNRLFARIELEPATREDTRALLGAVAATEDVDAATLDRVMELADFYLQGTKLPGRAVGLLRRVLARAAGATVGPRDVLETLAEATGIPPDFLDDAVPLDPADVRAFLEARVMGQPGAVEAVCDLVTLVKAGLNDPMKPYGVLFFVGPTGVGKTELARSLAELLFGDAKRLKRFDMSEYASFGAYERLIGTAHEPGLLTGAVRDQPFSVILLDEIEKAHLNVFDLCLQIFDAGRLTDGQGRTTDFRNTIVILTSNVGSRVRTDPQVGFGDAGPPPPDEASTLRELRRWFRPEFLNRLDRIVHFRPLAAETAEKIARREVARVLERSGIARRRLTVDVDPALLALLLQKGYSPAFGARPLKRTVERIVLLPVARAIAGGAVEPGSVLRLVAKGGRAAVEVVDRGDAPDAPPPPPADLDEVAAAVAALREKAAPVAARKADLLARSNEEGFWDDRDRARRILDEIHRSDAILGDLQRLEENLARTCRNRDPARAAEFTERHRREADRLGLLLECGDLADAIVTVTRVKAQNGGVDGVERLARMYAAFAKRRGLECEVMDDRRGGDPTEDTITLGVGGAGAFALLEGEAGLHHLSYRRAGGSRPEKRELVRVEVLRAADEALPKPDVRTEARPLRDRVEGRLLRRPRVELRLLHVPTMTSVVAWTERHETASLEAWLCARVEHARGPSYEAATVRRYRLGSAPLVRDRRTGRSTGNLDRVLRGELEPFLKPRRPRR